MGQTKPQTNYRPPVNKHTATMAPKRPDMDEPEQPRNGCLYWFVLLIFGVLGAFVYYWWK